MWDSFSTIVALWMTLAAVIVVFGVWVLWLMREDQPVAVTSAAVPAMMPSSYARQPPGRWIAMRRQLWIGGFAVSFWALSSHQVAAQTVSPNDIGAIVKIAAKNGGLTLVAVYAIWRALSAERALADQKVGEADRRRAETEAAKDREHREAVAKLAEKDKYIDQLIALNRDTTKALGELNPNVGGITQMMQDDRRSGDERRKNAR